MTQFKGTPGPWEIKPEEVDRPYIRIRGTRLGGRFKVANVLSPNYDGVDHREAHETRANARLIAAAPELLEALTVTLDEIGHWLSQQKPELRQKIVSAINKATGETK